MNDIKLDTRQSLKAGVFVAFMQKENLILSYSLSKN